MPRFFSVRFDQAVDVSDEDRDLAFANIRKAAEYYGVDITEKNWKELGSHPSTGRTKKRPQEVGTHGRRDAQRARAEALEIMVRAFLVSLYRAHEDDRSPDQSGEHPRVER
jgi:hypothetical protein